MKILLVGATGRTGRLVLEQAGLRKHSVTAIVRNPTNFPSASTSNMIVGDPLSGDVLAPALADQDAVISCLGQRSSRDANLLRESAAAMVAAMARAHVHRYIVVSQGLLFPTLSPIVAMLRWVLARHVADSTAMEQLVRASQLDWTIVRPPMLTEAGSPRGYRVKANGLPRGAWAMRRIDLASFLLDEAECGAHQNQIVGIASASAGTF